MPRLQGLIFDLDGTLLDSAPDLRRALNLTLQENGRRALTLDEAKALTGDGMLPMLSRAFARTGAPIDDKESYLRFQQFIGHYRTLKPDPSQLYDDVEATLKKYYAVGIKLGLCTNKQEAATLRLISDLNLQSYFAFIAGGDTFPVHKPHGDHVRGVINQLQVPAESCVMIGDSANDVLAAHAARIPCIAVSHGYGIDIQELAADIVIGGFKDLTDALDKLGFTV